MPGVPVLQLKLNIGHVWACAATGVRMTRMDDITSCLMPAHCSWRAGAIAVLLMTPVFAQQAGLAAGCIKCCGVVYTTCYQLAGAVSTWDALVGLMELYGLLLSPTSVGPFHGLPSMMYCTVSTA